MTKYESTILVVEDDPNDQTFIVKAFRELGLTGAILVAHDGLEAIAYMRGEGKCLEGGRPCRQAMTEQAPAMRPARRVHACRVWPRYKQSIGSRALSGPSCSGMKYRQRAGLTLLETQGTHRGPRWSLERRHQRVDETRKTPQVMVNAPTALRAYILADAALVRGTLTRCQRAQVVRAQTELRHGVGRPRTGQPAATLKADTRLGLTQTAVLRRGESRSSYSRVLVERGFSREQIAEIIASLALSGFSHYLFPCPV